MVLSAQLLSWAWGVGIVLLLWRCLCLPLTPSVLSIMQLDRTYQGFRQTSGIRDPAGFESSPDTRAHHDANRSGFAFQCAVGNHRCARSEWGALGGAQDRVGRRPCGGIWGRSSTSRHGGWLGGAPTALWLCESHQQECRLVDENAGSDRPESSRPGRGLVDGVDLPASATVPSVHAGQGARTFREGQGTTALGLRRQ